MTSQQQKSSTPTTEMTRDDALKSLLTDGDLSDLSLQGMDGVLVIAHRILLASRSPVFRQMLYGEFSESSKTVIELGYNGAILQAIVDYIYTDRLPAFLDGKITWNIELVQFLMTFISAANYFDLPGLCQKLESKAEEEMDGDVANFILAGADSPTILVEFALNYVKDSPKRLVDGDKQVVSMIHPSYLEEILGYDHLHLDEQSCFQILQAWANAEELEDDNTHLISFKNSDRKIIAAQMTSHLRLEDIDATHLFTTVSGSGLVTTDQLNDAYRTQALRASKKLCTPNRKWRAIPVWFFSRSTLFERGPGQSPCTDILDCPSLKTGVHKWSIKVNSASASSVELGVISTYCQKGSFILRNQVAEIYLNDRGEDDDDIRDYRGNIPVVIPSNIESTISFTLDLTQNVVFTASLDGNTPVEIFLGIIHRNGEGFGFVPAVSWGDDEFGCNTGKVEFLGFE